LRSIAFQSRLRLSLGRDILPVVVPFLLMLALGTTIAVALSVAIFVYCLVWYADSLGRELAIVQALALLASGQWLLGPAIYYSVDAVAHSRYQMYVHDATYFGYMIPATLTFIFGLRVFFPQISIIQLRNYLFERRTLLVRAAYFVLFFGFVCAILADYVPAAFRFAFFLGSQATFIAVIYLIVMRSRWRWITLAAVFGVELAASSSEGMFHNILLWSALTLSFVCAELRLTLIAKLALLGVGIFLIVQLQTVKETYREMLTQAPTQTGVATLARLMLSPPKPEEQWAPPAEEQLGALHARLNQGWIISAVMAYVPRMHDFEEGRTFAIAIRDALLPRFLVEKRVVDSSDYVRRYTGLFVNRNTSFGISVPGEAWVNFGMFGIIFMFIFGAFYGIVFKGALYVAKFYPTIILWSPLLFLQAIKTETEFVIVLNHVIKSGLFIFILYLIFNNILRIRI